jgi:hypothetical protein
VAGFLLVPPGGEEPTVPADEAMATADNEEGVPAESKQALLAILPAGGNIQSDTLVWDIRYAGACMRFSGMRPATPSPGPHWRCGGTWNVLIDASKGTFIVSFTDDG